MDEYMLCHKDGHYYVRMGGLSEYYNGAQSGATNRLIENWEKGLRKKMEEIMIWYLGKGFTMQTVNQTGLIYLILKMYF